QDRSARTRRRDRGAEPARARLRPAGPRGGRADPGGQSGGSAAGPAGDPGGDGPAAGAGLHRRRGPGHPAVAVTAARRLAARGDRDPEHGPGLGLAVRARLRLARRRQGAGVRDAAAPGRAAGRGRAGGDHRRLGDRVDPGHGAGPAMILTWRAGALAGLAVVAVAVIGSWAAFLVATAVLAAVIIADVLLCPSPARVSVRRSGDTSIRLGDSGQVAVLLINHNRRAIRATVRDAWTPSAGATGGIRDRKSGVEGKRGGPGG